MILVDLSQTIIAICVVNLANDLKSGNPNSKNLIKHMTFSTLLSITKKNKDKYGDMILACDSKEYWRRDFFPAYKGHRKHGREDSPLDWTVIFEAIKEIKQEIAENFPWKVIEVPGAEADDVIAVMTKHLQENELIREGLFDDEPQPILIWSSDGDFVQLQKYPNVQQYSALQKKFVKANCPIYEFVIEHIVRGDTGDNIPNIFTPDSWALTRSDNTETAKQKSVTKTKLQEFLLHGEKACDSEELKRNWIRNQTLVDFSAIPHDLHKKIVDTYKISETKWSKTKLFNYFVKNRMKNLIEQINDF